MGAAASNTISEKPLDVEGDIEVMGQSKYDGSMTVFRYFGADGQPETGTLGGEIGDMLFQTLKTKGARVWVLERRTSKKATEAWAASDEYSLFEIITDNPQPQDGQEGYIKYVMNPKVQDAWLHKSLAA